MSPTAILRHRIFAALLGIGILALLTSTAALVIGSLTRTPSPQAASSIPKTTRTLDVSSLLTSMLQNHGHLSKQGLRELERPYITFIGDTLSPSDDKLTGTLEVIIPPGVPPFLTFGGKPVFNCAGPSCVPYSKFANDTIDASMLVTNAGVNFELHEPIKLSSLYNASILGVHEFPVTIPLKGYAGQYPQDRYTANVSLGLAFPSGMKPSFETGIHREVRTLQAGTVSNTYDVRTSPSPATYQNLVSNARDTFALNISRNWYDEFFVFCVALIPTLFALLFLHLLFFSRQGRGTGPYFEHFTEALIVAILSVLPLRAVLVPGDISGLTRVDLTLAVGLVLIVAVSAGKYAGEIWSRSHPTLLHGEHEEEPPLEQELIPAAVAAPE